MGMNLSFHSSDPYFSPERLSKEDSCHEKVTLVAWIVENIKPTCLRRKKRKEMQKKERQQKVKMEKELTLEEWLLKSPIIEKNVEHSEECSLEQLLRSGDYTAVTEDYIISTKKLLKDEKVEVEEMEFDSLTRSPSSKGKKRVSFRQPKVSDIIIFHSSDMDFEE